MADLKKLTVWARALRIPPQHLWFELLDENPAASAFSAQGASGAALVAPPPTHNWREQDTIALFELDEQLLSELRARTERYRWLDRQQSGALLPITAQHARDLATLWRLTDDDHALRADLGKIAADACRLVAYQALDTAAGFASGAALLRRAHLRRRDLRRDVRRVTGLRDPSKVAQLEHTSRPA